MSRHQTLHAFFARSRHLWMSLLIVQLLVTAPSARVRASDPVKDWNLIAASRTLAATPLPAPAAQA